MKKGLFFILILFFPFSIINAQSGEPEEENFSIISRIYSSLNNAYGWSMQDNGKWAKLRNKIPNTNSRTNKNKTPKDKLGQENFIAFDLRKVTIKDKQYNILIRRYQAGKYEFPILQEGWDSYESIEFYVFKAENLKKILPSEISFNIPYAINTEVFCYGKVEDYDYRLLDDAIVSKIQSTLNKTEINATNLIIAIYPTQKNGYESIRFKLRHTSSKRSIYSYWIDPNNAKKIFEKSYYETQLSRFKKFIRDADHYNVPISNVETNDFESIYKNGVKKYLAGDWNGAIKDFNNAISLNPNSEFSLIYSFRGITHMKNKNYSAAIEDFDKALDIRPKYWEEGWNWVKNYHNRGVARFYDTNDIEGACEDWQTAFENGFGGSLEYLERYCK